MVPRIPSALLTLMIFAACSESVRVATTPPGARLYLDGREVGVTPYTFSVRRSQIREVSYRIELENYRTVEGTLHKRVAPGRVVGAVFTLGILYLFRSPFYIQSLNETLAIQPIQSRQAQQVAPIEERLKKLKQLRDEGVLSHGDYQRQKTHILEQSQ